MPDAYSPSSLGGGAGFPSTCWSRFMAPPGGDPGDRRAALEELARRYWRPIYAYIRMGWAKTHEDAKDLAQEFFLWIMEGEFLSKPDPAQGRFRTFLRVALKHYLINVDRDARRLKRGGDRPPIQLGDMQEWGVEDRGARSPEAALDEAWTHEILNASVGLLERELTQQGKPLQFRVFEAFHLAGGDVEPSYKDVAARLGISEVDVTNYLARTKARFRAIIAEQVSQTVSGDRELREEMQELFGGRL